MASVALSLHGDFRSISHNNMSTEPAQKKAHSPREQHGRPPTVRYEVNKFKAPERPKTEKTVRFSPRPATSSSNKARRPTRPYSARATTDTHVKDSARPSTAPQLSPRSTSGNSARGRSYLCADVDEITRELQQAWDRATEFEKANQSAKSRRKASRKKRRKKSPGKRSRAKSQQLQKSPNTPTPFPLPKDVEQYFESRFDNRDVQVSLDAMKPVSLYRTRSRSVFSPKRKAKAEQDWLEEIPSAESPRGTGDETSNSEGGEQHYQNLLIESPFASSRTGYSIIAKRTTSSSSPSQINGSTAMGGVRHFRFDDDLEVKSRPQTSPSFTPIRSKPVDTESGRIDEGSGRRPLTIEELRRKVPGKLYTGSGCT